MEAKAVSALTVRELADDWSDEQRSRAMNLQRVGELFEENFGRLGELGASVCVWRDGVEVLSLAGGWRDREMTVAWTAETPVLFWSATKGLAAGCLLHALQERGLDPSLRVSEVWPEFAQAGKERVTIGEVMSHQAGLSALTEPVAVTDYEAVIGALAAQAPHWRVGEGHGYHPRTFGFLVDEILRRITGGGGLGGAGCQPVLLGSLPKREADAPRPHASSGERLCRAGSPAAPAGSRRHPEAVTGCTMRDYWRTHFAEPLGLEAWIGAPAEIAARAAPVFPARTAPPKGDLFYTAFLTSGSFTAQSFGSPRGLHSVAALNEGSALRQSFPAFGGVGTARALGKFYAMLACGGELEGQRFFTPQTMEWMKTTLTQGADRVLMMETAFSAGFMRDPVGAGGGKTRAIFGPSRSAFGHPGAGGSHAFADPENRISFAYVMNQMEPGVLPGPKSLRLIEALYA